MDSALSMRASFAQHPPNAILIKIPFDILTCPKFEPDLAQDYFTYRIFHRNGKIQVKWEKTIWDWHFDEEDVTWKLRKGCMQEQHQIHTQNCCVEAPTKFLHFEAEHRILLYTPVFTRDHCYCCCYLLYIVFSWSEN